MAYAQVAFSMALLVWLAWYGRDGELHKLIAEGCLWLLFGNFVVYVSGSTVDDLVSLVKGVKGIPDNDRSTPK